MRYNCRMKVAIDVSQVVYGTGVSVYVRELTKALLSVDQENSYLIYGGSLRQQSSLRLFGQSLQGNFTTRFFPIPPTLADYVWNKLHTLPLERLLGRVDIVHTSDWSEPPVRKAKKVTTIHDVTPFRFPKETPDTVIEVHERKLAWVRKESAAIIVPSNVTKDDLVGLGFDKKKIHVVYEAVSDEFKKIKPLGLTEVNKRFGLNGKFLLAVGTAKRKNNDRLIAAAKGLAQIDRLVIVGEGASTDSVLFTGRITDQELVSLYTHAQALAYVSLYEGFGLPILEAFAFGTPVVASNIGSMKEIAGDAAVLVDPTNIADIKKGIGTAITNRISLVMKGRKREKEFSWEKAARETIDIYKKL